MDDFRKDLYFRVKMGRSGSTVDLDGVRLYYEIYGEGEPLFLFHGGMSTIETFRFQIPALARHYQLIVPERRGHGHTPDTEGGFAYEQMADDMAAFMRALGFGRSKIIGYSDGANLILFLALKHPALVERFVSVGGNYHHKGCLEAFQQDLRSLPEDSVGEGIDRNYEKYSPDGPGHYAKVFAKVRRLWLEEPAFTREDIARIAAPALIMAGDQDVISLEHTLDFYRSLPHSSLCIFPGSHSILKEQAEACNRVILDFLAKPVSELTGAGPYKESSVND